MPTSNFRLLVVEDDDHKLTAITSYVYERHPAIEIRIARSLSSALAALSEAPSDLAIVDMSLPTYDLAVDHEGGGTPQSAGGSEILRFIEAESAVRRALVLTQYTEFLSVGGGIKPLADLQRELKDEFGDWLLGVSFYSGQSGRWKIDIDEAIQKTTGE